jgi:hypothetical protein
MEEIRVICDSKIVITNTKTGKIYKDEEEVKLDTSANPEDIKRDVKIIVPPIPLFSKT